MPELGVIPGQRVSWPPQPLLPAQIPGLAPVAALIAERYAESSHGNLPGWRAALEALPELRATTVGLADTVWAQGPVTTAERAQLENQLQRLHPWRKGPFSLFGVHIDSEWRSDWKWQRLYPHLLRHSGPVRGQVLDVGCGNGYFGWRLLEAGAAVVVGIDPMLLYCLQHQAINRYLRDDRNWVLPLRFEELPDAEFDLVLSMGVIYHRRDPTEHLARLWRHTRPGGRVVLESLIVRGGEPLVPAERYARMRNVWVVPTTDSLCRWLSEAGFVEVTLADVTPTSTDEQRATRWMRFQSLAEALDPLDPTRTVEGYPAPVRAVVIATKPGRDRV
ncbi:MAG: tRNA 5-methoxyuridine(34)/uridine 5-oxyacetic acid(34) synthase CmoB [Pseudomonadales bacterium]